MWNEAAPPHELRDQATRLLMLAIEAQGHGDTELVDLLTARAIERMEGAAACEKHSSRSRDRQQ